MKVILDADNPDYFLRRALEEVKYAAGVRVTERAHGHDQIRTAITLLAAVLVHEAPRPA